MPETFPLVEDVAVAAPVQKDEKKKGRSLKKPVARQEFGGPARAKTSYFLFADDARDQATLEVRAASEKEGTSLKVADVSRLIASRWKGLADEEKKAYNDKAAEEKKKHDEAMTIWKASDDYKEFLQEEANHSKKKADKAALQKVKAAGLPKKPLNAYLLFGTSLELKGLALQARAQAVKEQWQALGQEKQAEWQQKASTLKEEYNQKMEEFKNSDEYETYAKTMEKNKKTKQNKVAKNSGEVSKKRGRLTKVQNADDDAEAEEGPKGKVQKVFDAPEDEEQEEVEEDLEEDREIDDVEI